MARSLLLSALRNWAMMLPQTEPINLLNQLEQNNIIREIHGTGLGLAIGIREIHGTGLGLAIGKHYFD